ncbi:hypothetical protein [Pseudomonas capsici]|uniref:hypothetical protein n=1 Tax=Pseudomonas capsici TaxID=2810614 RepID=UPI0021F0E109|nr:hypothetical protein [Pseudomonas capsici]MCV4343309.1 hypothetical protein [Pseudomonas capsici]
MSKAIDAVLESYQRQKSDPEKRAIAVAAALAIINAKVSNAPTYNGIIEIEMNKLSTYADQIQEALKVE